MSRHRHKAAASDVFGVSQSVLPDSYVDRGALDGEISRQLTRPTHLALNGASKAGKSWLRQRLIPEAVVVQCRLDKTLASIYTEALGQLGLRFEVSSSTTSSLTGTVEASGEIGIKLLAKVTGRSSVQGATSGTTTTAPISEDVNDLSFVAALIRESGRRLVIEDFHYLTKVERQRLAFDLKALWDFGVFAVVVGVWSDRNYLLHLNPDLTGRVREISIVWTDADLRQIFTKGGAALNLVFSEEFMSRGVSDAYGNAGILQRLILDSLDRSKIFERPDRPVRVDDLDALEHAEIMYAEELGSVYQPFAARVSAGFRKRQNATGIYAHAMAVIFEASDEELIKGVGIDHIFAVVSARETRIQKGNLRTVLNRIPSMQVDSEGRGLVLSYADDLVRVVDRQLLLYRKYATVRWPWEDLIQEAGARNNAFADDLNES